MYEQVLFLEQMWAASVIQDYQKETNLCLYKANKELALILFLHYRYAELSDYLIQQKIKNKKQNKKTWAHVQ